MQLLPGTAQDIARWSGYNQVSSIDLFNQKINLKLGTAYFRYAKQKLYNSNLYAVADNGGPIAVQRWLNRFPCRDTDQFIENIPYSQTRDYVRKVYGSYWNYKRIYHFS